MADDSRTIRIEDKLDNLGERMSSIETLLRVKHAAQDHRIAVLEKDLAPVKRKVAMAQGALKVIVGLAAFLGSWIVLVGKLKG